jgi:hypothetical protein
VIVVNQSRTYSEALFVVRPTVWKPYRYEIHFHFIKASSFEPPEHTSPTHSNTQPSTCDIYFVIWAVNELNQFATRHMKRKKNTGNILLLCITNLVCSQVAWPWACYNICGQIYRSIKACLYLHSSSHQIIMITAGKQTYWRSLMFVGPCIMIYFYSKNQLDAQLFEFIECHCTCFRQSFRPSSGVQNCTYSSRLVLWLYASGPEIELQLSNYLRNLLRIHSFSSLSYDRSKASSKNQLST